MSPLTFVIILTAILVGWIAYLFQNRPDSQLPLEVIDKLIIDAKMTSHNEQDKLSVIITGSTSGIGQALASELYHRGLKVIIASRSEPKILQTIKTIRGKHPDNLAGGELHYHILNIADLDSVEAFAEWYRTEHHALTFLVNNAGMHYVQQGMDKIFDFRNSYSPQGYDEVFATNYLGHFLLTEKLLPVIETNGRVINVASTYHILSSGQEILPEAPGQLPKAANGTMVDYYHRYNAYGHSKLAQILHARALQARLQTDPRSIKSISLCPCWVKTNMIPKDAFNGVLHYLAFTEHASLWVLFRAMFETRLSGGEFLSNTPVFPVAMKTFFDTLFSYLPPSVRPIVADLFAMVLLMRQPYVYNNTDYHSLKVHSVESENEYLRDALYQWTYTEMQSKGYL